MRLLSSDPDIETIVARINKGVLDLQPDFQRGEVWGRAKKVRLIDTILRDWHVPPVHLVEDEKGNTVVLDGQQRLAAIRDFVLGKIRVDGASEPKDSEIQELDGLTYEELPPKFRLRFDQYSIRVFRAVDYRPEEPGELFFRLNQPVSLTAAEQRNAFFGPTRQQIKHIVEEFGDFGLSRETMGFSNSRMAYDDVVARVCLCLENRTLLEKITAATLTERFRSNSPFSPTAVRRATSALEMLGKAIGGEVGRVKLNKATFFSWAIWLSDLHEQFGQWPSVGELGAFIHEFEDRRQSEKKPSDAPTDSTELRAEAHAVVFRVFNDRASSRVGDVSSVVARHAALWAVYWESRGTDRRSALTEHRWANVATLCDHLQAGDSSAVEEEFEYLSTRRAWDL